MGKYAIFLLLFLMVGCVPDEPHYSGESTSLLSEPAVLKNQHDQTCQKPYLRELILSRFHYYIAKEQQLVACEILYETGFYIAPEELEEDDVPVDHHDSLSAGRQSFGMKEKITVGVVAASLIVGVMITYKLLNHKKQSPTFTDELLSDTALRKRFNEAKHQYKNTHDYYAYRQELEALFKQSRLQKSASRWLVTAEVLDEVDSLHAAFGDESPLIVYSPDDSQLSRSTRHAVPLVDYSEIGYFTEAMTYFDQLNDAELGEIGLLRSDLSSIDKPQLIKHLEEKTGRAFIKEKSKVGEVVKAVYKQKGITGKLLRHRFLNALLTRIIGWRNREPASSAQIAQTALGLGITPFEIVTDNYNQRVYRGPKFLFGKGVSDFQSFNEFFVRDLTDEARQVYLKRARQLNADRLADYKAAAEANVSAMVIASADSRVRLATLSAGEVDKPQKLVGKVLNEDAAAYAAEKGEDPVYYGDEYAYKVSDALLVDLDDAQQVRYPSMVTEKNPVAAAQKTLLNLAFEDMNRRGVVQVTHRLAPADIHNYTASVNGKAMSHAEALDLLQAKASGQLSDEKNALIDSLRSSLANSAESSPLIEISGSRLSVAAQAIAEQPSILAQNNRKVLFMKHEGTSMYSVHLFIGATGVDQVNVEPGDDNKQGDRIGDMAFGLESAKGKLKSGERIGQFPVNGSTVQSFYFSDEFELLPSVYAFQEAFGNKDKLPELRMQMGDPVLQMKQVPLAQTNAHLIAKTILDEHGASFKWTDFQVKRALLKQQGFSHLGEIFFSKKQAQLIEQVIIEGKRLKR